MCESLFWPSQTCLWNHFRSVLLNVVFQATLTNEQNAFGERLANVMRKRVESKVNSIKNQHSSLNEPKTLSIFFCSLQCYEYRVPSFCNEQREKSADVGNWSLLGLFYVFFIRVTSMFSHKPCTRIKVKAFNRLPGHKL